jgi:RimJ/RimL family protein N-acetyltransferase
VVFERYRVEGAIAEMDTRNASSIALVEALGFVRQRTERDVAEFKGSTSHEHVYALSRTEWIEGRSRQAREAHS